MAAVEAMLACNGDYGLPWLKCQEFMPARCRMDIEPSVPSRPCNMSRVPGGVVRINMRVACQSIHDLVQTQNSAGIGLLVRMMWDRRNGIFSVLQSLHGLAGVIFLGCWRWQSDRHYQVPTSRSRFDRNPSNGSVSVRCAADGKCRKPLLCTSTPSECRW